MNRYRSHTTINDYQDNAVAITKIETTKYWKTMGLVGKVASGKATKQETDEASNRSAELLTTARFFAFMMIPGAIFFLPAAIEASKMYDFDFVPETVSGALGI